MPTIDELISGNRGVRLEFSSESSTPEGGRILKWALPDLFKYSKGWRDGTKTPLIVDKREVSEEPPSDWFATIITFPSWQDALAYAFNVVPHRLATMGSQLGIPEGTWGVDVRLTDGSAEVEPSEIEMGFLSITLPANVAQELLAKVPSGYTVDGERAVIHYPLPGLGSPNWSTSPFGESEGETFETTDEGDDSYLTTETGEVLTDEEGNPLLVESGPLPFGLTRRELEVYKLIMSKLSEQEVAKKLGVSVSTVRFHLDHANQKLGDRSWVEVLEKLPELSKLLPVPKSPTSESKELQRRLEEALAGVLNRSDTSTIPVATIIVDPDIVAQEDVVLLARALSRAYERAGGEPLTMEDGGTGVFEFARVRA